MIDRELTISLPVKYNVHFVRAWMETFFEQDLQTCQYFIKTKQNIKGKDQNTCAGCPLHPEFSLDMLLHPEKYTIGDLMCFNSVSPDQHPLKIWKEYRDVLKERRSNVEKIIQQLQDKVFDNSPDLRKNLGRKVLIAYTQMHKKFTPFHLLALETWNMYIYLSKIPREEIEERTPETIMKIRKKVADSKDLLVWWNGVLSGRITEDVEVTFNGEVLCKL